MSSWSSSCHNYPDFSDIYRIKLLIINMDDSKLKPLIHKILRAIHNPNLECQIQILIFLIKTSIEKSCLSAFIRYANSKLKLFLVIHGFLLGSGSLKTD